MISIKNILMKKPDKMLLIQARISQALAAELKPFMKKNNFGWSDLVRASLVFLRNELKEDEKKK